MNSFLKTAAFSAAFFMVQLPAQAQSITDFLTVPHVVVKAERAFENGRYDRAVSLLSDRAARLSQSDAQARAYSVLCQSLYKLEKYQAAKDACDHALDTRDAHWADYNTRGGAHYQLGQYEMAAGDFKNALKQNPGKSQIARNLKLALKANANVQLAVNN